MKRSFDIFVSIIAIILLSPILIFFIIRIWLEDRSTPFYIAPRIGRGGRVYNLIKFRSMIINADKTGVDSTSDDDKRITKVGQFIRKYKIDELPNFINILLGDMSLIGPRPNVKREVELYSDEEKKLLSVRPGVSDFASIVFADEGEILKNCPDPDIGYNQLIRPWKSILGIIYVENHNILMDIPMLATIVVFISVFSIVYIIRRQSIDYSAYIAVVLGAFVNVFGFGMAALFLELSIDVIKIGMITFGGIILACVVQMLFRPMDYGRTETVQYEDDENYYYVKIVPKISIDLEEQKVEQVYTSNEQEEKETL